MHFMCAESLIDGNMMQSDADRAEYTTAAAGKRAMEIGKGRAKPESNRWGFVMLNC